MPPQLGFVLLTKSCNNWVGRLVVLILVFYTLRDSNNQLCGILGVHVDDCAVGGQGQLFE